MDNSAANLGYVLLALASLVGIACGLKTLFGKGASNGAAVDVTRREFEEVKSYAKEGMHEIKGALQTISTRLAVIEVRLGGAEEAKPQP